MKKKQKITCVLSIKGLNKDIKTKKVVEWLRKISFDLERNNGKEYSSEECRFLK